MPPYVNSCATFQPLIVEFKGRELLNTEVWQIHVKPCLTDLKGQTTTL